MPLDKTDVYELLRRRNINHAAIEHAAVFNMLEMEALHIDGMADVAKNLFVRDGKKRHYYLIVAREDKHVNLKALGVSVCGKSFGLASETDLEKFLSLKSGSVSPFGILNDESKSVKVLIDKTFRDGRIGVHPNDNTATVFLSTADLVAILTDHGNLVEFMEI